MAKKCEGENWKIEFWKHRNLTHFSLHFPTPVLAHSTALTVLISEALPLVLEFQLDQCPGMPPPTHLAASWPSCEPVLLEDISESCTWSAASPLRPPGSLCFSPLWYSFSVIMSVHASVSHPPKLGVLPTWRACLIHGWICRPEAQSSHSKSVE